MYIYDNDDCIVYACPRKSQCNNDNNNNMYNITSGPTANIFLYYIYNVK